MSLDLDGWGISSRVYNAPLRKVPHIFWSPHMRRWVFIFQFDTHYTRNDLDAQEYINMLNVTKQAHPIK